MMRWLVAHLILLKLSILMAQLVLLSLCSQMNDSPTTNLLEHTMWKNTVEKKKRQCEKNGSPWLSVTVQCNSMNKTRTCLPEFGSGTGDEKSSSWDHTTLKFNLPSLQHFGSIYKIHSWLRTMQKQPNHNEKLGWAACHFIEYTTSGIFKGNRSSSLHLIQFNMLNLSTTWLLLIFKQQ